MILINVFSLWETMRQAKMEDFDTELNWHRHIVTISPGKLPTEQRQNDSKIL